MDNFIPTLRDALLLLSGILIHAIPTWIKTYREYKKARIEDNEAQARIGLTEESTRSLRLRDDLATAESVGKMLGDLMETGDKLSELQGRIYELEQDRIELHMARNDVKQLKGLLDAHKISYSEKDKPRES